LLEQAINNAYQNERYQAIHRSISALVFFATPHAGGKDVLVRIARFVAAGARISFLQPNRDIIEHLNRRSSLSELRETYFAQRKLDFRIISFWEGEGEVSVPMAM
jgi:hypothetical protein